MIDLESIESQLDDFSKVVFFANIIGITYYDSKRDEEALGFYDKALKINPNYASAYNNKGWSLSNLGKDEEAIIEYDKALKINPKYIKCLLAKSLS